MESNIIYESSVNHWENFIQMIQNLVEQHSPQYVCDIGGGATPVLSIEFVNKHGIDLTLLDISKTELDKAPSHYNKIVQDIASEKDFPLTECFDLVFSRMLAEHLKNGQVFHENIFTLLKPGGIAVHYFPTLYDFPFIVNKIVPESISNSILDILYPSLRDKRGKFFAYYSWCFGPTPKMLKMLTDVGFEIIEFRGLFGHPYFDNFPLIKTIYSSYAEYLLKHPNPYLTSFSQIVLRKPFN